MLKITNSLTGEKLAFQPIERYHIRLYVCGITVYDYCHIGHARAMIVFDVVVRYLRMCGYAVTYVRNITDIDDKIIKRALENNETVSDLTERFINAMHEDTDALGLLPPDNEPRATDYIPQIIDLTQALLDRGFAYITDSGEVCFEVRKDPDYGKLSHRDIEKLRTGVRVDINDTKRDPLDFVLWKQAKPDEPQWDSPWGSGRPGWHIECSAMAASLLGQPFDIHGGGMDLKFPHHENEIAQSECGLKQEFAKNWMHVGLLQVNKEKMSKSLGNFFTIREVLAKHHSEVIRYFMIASHYRSPVNYSEDNLQQMRQSLAGLYLSIRGLPDAVTGPLAEPYMSRFNEKMDDDFNTPEALAVLFELAHAINRHRDNKALQPAAELAATLKKLGAVLGILQSDPEDFLRGTVSDVDQTRITQLIKDREKARGEKNWALADQIRAELEAMGVMIEDGADGTIWRRV